MRPIAALLLTNIYCVAVGCSSSSGGGSDAIVGEWQLVPDPGSSAISSITYFDSNGTGGDLNAVGGMLRLQRDVPVHL